MQCIRLTGGYTPKIAGRPLSLVEEFSAPGQLVVRLERKGIRYTPAVRAGDEVRFGSALAWASTAGGVLKMPAPASGLVSLTEETETAPACITLDPIALNGATDRFRRFDPQRASLEAIRGALANGGVWPLFWSSLTNGTPTLHDSERPAKIVVNCVTAEPFRARGKVILRRSWDRIIQGMRFLPRLMADYGTIEVILTERKDPVARMMHTELTGYAWVRFHFMPVWYPVENPFVLTRALRRTTRESAGRDAVWVIDVQAVEALGACLAEGEPPRTRIVAVGGPGCENPRHLKIPIGTTLSAVADLAGQKDNSLMLRGGIMTGEPVDAERMSVGYDDDAYFFLPCVSEREFLSFAKPGLDRRSVLPCFASVLTGRPDSRITNSLRGEHRPCIACGLCEKVCPVGLLPQVLHRYLYRDALDEAEQTGLDLCIGCGLCSYVCPSKIELNHQFEQAKEQVRREHEEAAASEADRALREETKQLEKKHSADWIT